MTLVYDRLTDENEKGPIMSMHQAHKVQELCGLTQAILKLVPMVPKSAPRYVNVTLMLHAIFMLQPLILFRNTFEKNLKIIKIIFKKK